MATRKYEQKMRAESAAETRRRILNTVEKRLREAPTEPVSLDQVARQAQVSRSTIYVAFGSKAGLFDAFVQDLWDRTGIADLTRAVEVPDAREHLRGGVAAASKMLAADRDIYSVLYGMARLDPDSVGGAVDKMNAMRRGGMSHLANRLAEDGLLRPDITIERATDLLWMLCSFEAFDLLYSDRNLTVDQAVDLIVTTAERTLCA